MKTPDEIKKGLEQCANTQTCENCNYRDECVELYSNKPLTRDALAYIQQLESDNESKQKRIDELESRLAHVERERDAAVEDFTQFVNYGEHECKLCRHNEEVCLDCTWEWRGVKINDD